MATVVVCGTLRDADRVDVALASNEYSKVIRSLLFNNPLRKRVERV